jgi:hypothetical protein
MSTITAVYYTADALPDKFAKATGDQLRKALGDIPLVVVHKDPATPRSQAQIYRQVLEGAYQAKTKYVALCEDDVLYHEAHFEFRPKPGHWGYNMNAWNIYTWSEPMFSYKAPGGRRNLNGLICERQMLINHLEERFKLWPDDSKIDIRIFGEPGKYDNQLGTTPYPSEDFYINPPNIVFSHQANLQFKGLGTRKALGQIRATEIPTWGTAKSIRSLYE